MKKISSEQKRISKKNEVGNKRHYHGKQNFKKNSNRRKIKVKNLNQIVTNNRDLEYQLFIYTFKGRGRLHVCFVLARRMTNLAVYHK